VSNISILSFYLFSPCWVLYFVMGGILAFIYGEYTYFLALPTTQNTLSSLLLP
jgi:hypothetical protein